MMKKVWVSGGILAAFCAGYAAACAVAAAGKSKPAAAIRRAKEADPLYQEGYDTGYSDGYDDAVYEYGIE